MKIFLPLVLVLLLFGCQKQTIVCTGNCGIISISGTTFNKITNTAEPNVPISLDWAKARICICSQKNVFTGQSGSDGSFTITANIDTSMFKDHGLRLYVTKNDDFIVIRDSAFANNNSYRSYTPGGYPPVQLNIYPQATLKIILQRSQTDNFESFGIQHSAVNENNTVSDYAASSPKEVTDRNVKELTVPTVAGVFTKIISTKRINSTQTITKIDSVKCTRGGANTFTVVF
jgi:hypothetical protein